ncbi:hypothetical protein MBM_02222 [Drepanopeziza brunnea f. sp. 'multigermtubi' MB_m1]|uniref:Uncharacterized protein n=1 Tax=Marssonina brunnea f. sp. multigermtubi (strain MB_m1) TaxID=1072389 RepID=K1WMQ0_MARBU|nr:uncharacterized protein MBM_02222 [Drepanopeziza brunnea f. sp. 'multigermtubi' MB_m1]EKD18985.1 hypothetical protein MBM_02222 [Drepanopeziza brunnea f. sp. 'multigermtubi' MB_m1]
MSTDQKNKERITMTLSDADGFVRVSLGAAAEQIDLGEDEDEDIAGSGAEQKDEMMEDSSWLDLEEEFPELEGVEAPDDDGMTALLNSTSDLGDVELDDLMEIEREFPEEGAATRPCVNGDNAHSVYRSDDDVSRSPPDRPATPTFPPGLFFNDDDQAPAPVVSHRPSHPDFEVAGRYLIDDLNDEPYIVEGGNHEEGVVEDDRVADGSVRFSEAVQTRAEWELSCDPILGKYRAKSGSNLRFCWTTRYSL